MINIINYILLFTCFYIYLKAFRFAICTFTLNLLLFSGCQPPESSELQLDLKWQIDVANLNEEPITGSRTILFANTLDANFERFSYQLHLTKSIEQLDLFEFWYNDVLVLSEEYYHASVAGLCMSPDLNRLVFFIDSVDEGIGNGGTYHHVLGQNPQNQWRVARLSHDIGPEIELNSYVEDQVNCQIQQSSVWTNFQRNPYNQPCVCDFNHEIFAYSEAEKWQEVVPQGVSFSLSMSESLTQGEVMSLPMQLIGNQIVIEQLIEGAQVKAEYQIETYTANEHTFVNIVHDGDELNRFAYSFIQKESLWYVWDVAGNSSKGFHFIDKIKQSTDGILQMQVCVDDCQWWGELAEFELDLTTLKIKYLTNLN